MRCLFSNKFVSSFCEELGLDLAKMLKLKMGGNVA
jgi:hypothetical protein